MAQSEHRPPRGGNRPPPAQDPNFNWRGVILFAVAIAFIGGAFFLRGPLGSVSELPYPALLKQIDDGFVQKDNVELVTEQGSSTVYLKGVYQKDASKPREPFKTVVNLQFNQNLKAELLEHGVRPIEKWDNNLFASALLGFLPIALFLLILYFFFRQQIRMAGKGALNFGKSKARMLSRDKNKITFKEVAGVEEAKDEVQEIVEFLKDPKKFQKLGGRIPKVF
jgi:cell division protease FtsH